MIRLHFPLGAVVAIAGISGCVTLPAIHLAPAPAVAIAAPAEQAWESALDQLAAQGIAVRTVERESGFIATETIALPLFSTDPVRWANCGAFITFPYAPTAVDYTIFVRGDSIASSVKTSARYRLHKSTGEVPTDCVSTGVFEQSFNASAKQRAELTQ